MEKLSREIRLTCFIINGNKNFFFIKYARLCEPTERIKKLNYENEFINDLSWSRGGKFVFFLFYFLCWRQKMRFCVSCGTGRLHVGAMRWEYGRWWIFNFKGEEIILIFLFWRGRHDFVESFKGQLKSCFCWSDLRRNLYQHNVIWTLSACLCLMSHIW